MDAFNEECKVQISLFFEKLTQVRHRLPSEDAVHSILETIAFSHDEIGIPVDEIQSAVINYALERSEGKQDVSTRATHSHIPIQNNYATNPETNNYATNPETNNYATNPETNNYATNPETKNIIVSYKTIGVFEHKFKNIDYDDMIWLHFALRPEYLLTVGKALVDILTDNDINYNLKMPNIVGPDAILVGLFSKEQASLVIQKCGENAMIKNALLVNNPFLPHQNRIGVTKEMMKRSYSRHMSSLILDYARNCDKPKLTFYGFIRHVMKLFNEDRLKRRYQERLSDYYAAFGLYCVDNGADYLDEVLHHKDIVFDKEFFEGHRIVYENQSYRYTTKDERHIEQEDSFAEWLQLQAYHCMQRIYYEQCGELPKEDFKLNEVLVAQLSTMIDDIMCGEPFYNTSKYNDLMINELYPYLVGYYASEAKIATPEEVNNIINAVSRRMVTKLKVDGANKSFYQIGEQTIQSTIPPIRLDNLIVGIEYLDYELNYCNVFVYQNDKVKGHLGLFLDVDKTKIWEDGDIGSSMYRAAIAHDLSRFDSLEKEPIVRGVHEGILVHLDGNVAENEKGAAVTL